MEDAGTGAEAVSAEIPGEVAEETQEVTTEETAAADGETQDADSEGGETKGKRQTTLEERVAELAERRAEEKVAEKFAELQAKSESEWKAKHERETIPYVQLTKTEYENTVTGMKEAINLAEMEGRVVDALDLQDQLSEYRLAVKQNEKVRQEFESRKQAEARAAAEHTARFERLDHDADIYRQHHGIPKEAWDTAGKWVAEELATKPLLAKKFMQIEQRQGGIAAIEFLHSYATENMGKGAKADIDAKNASKPNLSVSAPAGKTAIKSWDALMKLPGGEVNKFYRENQEEYFRLKESHFKK